MALEVTGQAALFDMDGTLVDSTVVVETVWTGFATRHGLDAAAVLAAAHGVQSRDTIARFLPGADTDALVAEFLADEIGASDGVTEIPGAAAFVAAVAARVPVAIVTSAQRELAELRLALAGIPAPDVLIAAEDVVAGKPDPEGYVLAARRLGVPVEQCLAFEDAGAGLLAARASGATAVVVGDHAGPAASDLLRLRDLRRVRVAGDVGVVRISPA